MHKLTAVSSIEDIPREIKDTPIGLLLEYHNLKRAFNDFSQANLLIGMCMDNRKRLRIPDNFSYIIRTGGANLRYCDFQVSYAIAVGGVKAIALIGHTHCGMVNLKSQQEKFVRGLMEYAGWEKDRAEEHFLQSADKFEIGNEVNFVLSESKRLRLSYPGVQVYPMLYRVEDNLLHLIRKVQA
ncbi:MAG: carbonic anhydrase [Chloroflexota bacterium]